MRVEHDPTLPDDAAEALDAEGRLIARFAPTSDHAPTGTASLRVSTAAFERIVATLAEFEKNSR
jgi:hypothetical protein